MIELGLLGYPLEHSFSPALHEAALRASGLDGRYSLYPVVRGDAVSLRDLVGRVRTGELRGLNVTIPHKQAIIPFLDGLTATARAVGAVNTIYLQEGRVWGDNTDTAGFAADLHKLGPTSGPALVLGAGGAARAVIHCLRSMGWAVTIAARRREQARELADQFAGVEALLLDAPGLQNARAGLIVNATPAGMFPDIEACPWPRGAPFPEEAAVYDLVYNPPETRLVREARAAGLRARSGLGMLIEQAALAFELWTGRKVEREVLHNVLAHIIR
ncbi:MAG: shikimate dehydrogenase [Bacteroidota bacterium]